MTIRQEWQPLSRKNSDHEVGVSTTISRLDILFAEDPFVSMLDVRLRNKLAVVLALGHVGWSPQFTAHVLKQTPYANLWSQEFINHIKSLAWIASGITPTEENQ